MCRVRSTHPGMTKCQGRSMEERAEGGRGRRGHGRCGGRGETGEGGGGRRRGAGGEEEEEAGEIRGKGGR